MKDNFSKQSDLYSKFRPGYPKQLFEFLLPLLPVKNSAWDCGTGNGQLAVTLSKYFTEVYATDISVGPNYQCYKEEKYYLLNAKRRTHHVARQ